jgi:hypothetical protein
MKYSIEKIAARILEKQEATKALPGAAKYDESRKKLPIAAMAGSVGGGLLLNTLAGIHVMPELIPPGEDLLPDMEFNMPDGSKWSPPKKTYPTEVDQKHLYDSLDESLWSKHKGSKPDFYSKDPTHGGRHGPYYVDPSVLPEELRRGAGYKMDKHYVYVPRTSSPEILGHELGHSLQPKWLSRASMLGRLSMAKPLALPANIASVLAYRADKEHPGLSDAAVYGLGGAGALGVGTTLAEEVGASLKGRKLMKQVGMKPRAGKLFIPNLTYLGMGALMQGIPISLAVKRFMDNRKRDAVANTAQAPTPGLLGK